MNVLWTPRGWAEYEAWQQSDRAVLVKMNALVAEIRRTPFAGRGKPEPLERDLTGWWARRITSEHRFVYRVQGSGEAQRVEIAQCRYQY